MRTPSVSAADATEDDGFERPSKTQRKKASHELQDLGEALVEMPPDRLASLDIPERLREAVAAARRITAHEGRRRQMQFVGKLMRGVDVAPIRQAVEDLRLGRAKDALALHEAERWRAELIADDDAATRFVADHPGCDVQQLRALVRNARKDASLEPEKRSGRAFRELFQYVKQHHV